MNRKMLTAATIVIAALAGIGGLLGSQLSAAGQTTVSALAGETHFHGLAVDQAQPSRLYLATHHGLYLVTADGSATQLAETNDDFMGFTPHPTEPAVLYASGHPRGGGNLGFLVSKNGGRTWDRISDGAGERADFHQMDVSRSQPTVIYGVHGELQRSADGGRSWRRIGRAPDKLIDLAVAAGDPNTLYAATQAGLVRSEDGGRSWQPMQQTTAPATMVHVAADGAIYAFVVGLGLLRASEPALEWQLVDSMAGGGYLLHFAADPTDGRKLYAVSYDPGSRRQSIIASRDGGASWTELGR